MFSAFFYREPPFVNYYRKKRVRANEIITATNATPLCNDNRTIPVDARTGEIAADHCGGKMGGGGAKPGNK